MIHWPTVLVTVAVLGSAGVSAFMLALGIHLRRRDMEAVEEATELSSRNIRPPSYGLRVIK